MLNDVQLKGLTAHLEAHCQCTVATPDDGPVAVAAALLRALAAAVPGSAPVVDGVLSHAARVSVTVPTPLGTLVVLSTAALATPLTRARTVVHEAVHAWQIVQLGGPQTAVDYLGSGELRALREAHACVAAAWVEYLLTGHLPEEADAVVASLGSHLYHLDEGERALARGVAASSLATIRAGHCPPIEVCRVVLAWLRAEAPETIVPERFHVADGGQ